MVSCAFFGGKYLLIEDMLWTSDLSSMIFESWSLMSFDLLDEGVG
jgi:hypothetical protein